MNNLEYLILLIAVLAYLGLPGVGAFLVRSKWRHFRRRVVGSTLLPRIDFKTIREGGGGLLGEYRFLGYLQAIQEDDTVWIRNEELTVRADLSNVTVYLLSSSPLAESLEMREEYLLEGVPGQVSWSRISSLPEGTEMVVSGPLLVEGGTGIFKSAQGTDLMVLIYDGSMAEILRRAISTGRHRNEYWNLFTPAALIAGSLSLFLLTYIFLRDPMLKSTALLSFTFALTPILPLFPPGAGFFFLYRALWKRGRILRAERDLLRLPLRYFSSLTGEERTLQAPLPDGGTYRMELCVSEEEAAAKTGNPITWRGRYPGIDGGGDWYAFFMEGGGDEYSASDPMVESLAIPGHPSLLARQCQRQAEKYEISSIAIFLAGILINYWILILILRSVI
ncbi:MAG: hypothetical protein KAU17_01330 [Spirochaetales bacterium]|nr:hypothetical protein [Spirochaetales bacterium]